MTGEDIFKRVRAKAIAMGVKKELLEEDLFVDILNKAMQDFCFDTKVNSKHVYTNTIEDQEYYTLPSDFQSPIRVMMDGIKLTPNGIAQYFDYIEANG